MPSADIERWSAEHARHVLRVATEHWPARTEILRLCDAMLGPTEDLTRAIEHLAGAIDRGQLLAVRVRDDPPGRPRLEVNPWDDPAWSSAPMLSDLLQRDGDEDSAHEPVARSTVSREPSPEPDAVVGELPAVVADLADTEAPRSPAPVVPPDHPPRATVVSIDGWWETQAVMVFQSARQTDFGPVTVRGILRQALCMPVRGEVHVAGHADTLGAAADNDQLALERARSVHRFLAGDRVGWAEHASAHADTATLQAALRWIALHGATPCDPGPVDGDWGPATAAGLGALRSATGRPDDGPANRDDWAAIYDAFDDGLATMMLTDRAGLANARARIQTIDPESMGERFPSHAPASDGLSSAQNRRVDVVFCAAGAIPGPGGDELYDGTFALDHVEVGPECPVGILVTDPTLRPVPHGLVLAEFGALGSRWLRADERGVVTATALRGDRIRVARATDRGGSGTMVNHGLRESLGETGDTGASG